MAENSCALQEGCWWRGWGCKCSGSLQMGVRGRCELSSPREKISYMADSRHILRVIFTGSENIFVGLVLHLMTNHKHILLYFNLEEHINIIHRITIGQHDIGFHVLNRYWE